MKISYESESNDARCSFTEREDLDIYDMIDVLEKLLIGIGYDQNVIKEGFIAKAEEIKNE